MDEYGDQQLAEEDYDADIHIETPHKNDLGLGRILVFDFVERFYLKIRLKLTNSLERVALT